jgi:hypothetical protein
MVRILCLFVQIVGALADLSTDEHVATKPGIVSAYASVDYAGPLFLEFRTAPKTGAKSGKIAGLFFAIRAGPAFRSQVPTAIAT